MHVKKMRRITRTKYSESVAAQKAVARRARRKLVLYNDLILMERYRKEIRQFVVWNSRERVEQIQGAIKDILLLKEKRNNIIIQLINISIDKMIKHLKQILKTINEIFAQYVTPISFNLEDHQEHIRNDIKVIYELFCSQFHFEVNLNTDEFVKRKFSSFALDTKMLQGPIQSEERATTLKALEMQKETLISIIDQEEIKTIALEQILKEKIEKVNADIASFHKQERTRQSAY